MQIKRREYTILTMVVLVTALVLGACSSPSGSSSNQPVDVKVSLTEFKVESSITTFTVGVPYHFVITNNGTVAHELVIAPPSQAGSNGTLPTPTIMAMVDKTQLQPGQTATLDYTFTQAAAAGTLELACYLPGHYEAGMHIPITVNK
jgi:uncharacterized cupredoxin-like copper-binding protein